MDKNSFGTCVFRERPTDCARPVDRRLCAGTDWEIVKCYLDHYGNRLTTTAPIRLMDAFIHVVINNDDVGDE